MQAMTERAAIADDTAQESAPQTGAFTRDNHRLKIFEFMTNHQFIVIRTLTQAAITVEPNLDR